MPLLADAGREQAVEAEREILRQECHKGWRRLAEYAASIGDSFPSGSVGLVRVDKEEIAPGVFELTYHFEAKSPQGNDSSAEPPTQNPESVSPPLTGDGQPT